MLGRLQDDGKTMDAASILAYFEHGFAGLASEFLLWDAFQQALEFGHFSIRSGSIDGIASQFGELRIERREARSGAGRG